MSRERKRYPTNGIYTVKGGLPEEYYLTAEARRRYRYVKPADYAMPQCWLADCWIVDKQGHINPGTCNSPVPIAIDQIGRRLTRKRINP